jgi:dTMP kinase
MTTQRPLARGILVALEGIDGTGKSTQARHLAAIFREQGYVVALLREPTVSPWGRRIREAMTAGHRVLTPSQELDLFLQDRRYDVAAHIRPALAARQLVLMDRYYFSTIAYQGALGIDPEHIRRLNEAFAPVPDLVLLLMVPPARALERIRQARGQADDVFEREDHLNKVNCVYRTLKGPHVHPIDAGQPIEIVTAAMRQKIQETLSTCSLSSPAQGRE